MEICSSRKCARKWVSKLDSCCNSYLLLEAYLIKSFNIGLVHFVMR